MDELELYYTVDEHGMVWEIRNGDTRRIGPKEQVFEEWVELMASEDFGEPPAWVRESQRAFE